MKKYIAVLELEADEEIIDADVYYNYRSNGKDYSVIGGVEFKEDSKQEDMKTYEDGLNEAWALARDIIALPTSENESLAWVRKNVFGDDTLFDIIRNNSASEIIKKIKEYEEIIVGDEIIDKYGWKSVVTNKDIYNGITIMFSDGTYNELCQKAVSDFKKTGRHFPEIEEILKRMKED